MTFAALLDRCAVKAYPEPRSPVHDVIGRQAVQWLCGSLKPNSSVLDLGCGSAFCAEMFLQAGHRPVAVSVLAAEVDGARKLGLTAAQLEMHAEATRHLVGAPFDLIWLRHVAEHSPCPLLLLTNCHEAAAVDGLLYLEVPLPWTACLHELNADHFSVLTELGWEQLLPRAGWQVISRNDWPLLTGAGPDRYKSFVCRKA